MKQNVQRTLAIELQKLSVQFRKQQKAYLNKLRKTSAASSSFSLLDETGPTARVDEEYDPGFSEIQVCIPLQRVEHGAERQHLEHLLLKFISQLGRPANGLICAMWLIRLHRQ